MIGQWIEIYECLLKFGTSVCRCFYRARDLVENENCSELSVINQAAPDSQSGSDKKKQAEK